MTPKFRAWIKPLKQMTKHVSIDEFSVTAFSSNDGVFTGDNIILMQFTGALDADGKEIYDGDILEYFSLRKIVGWNDETLQWSLKSRLDQKAKFVVQMATVDLDKSRIVGNICENFQLIKEK